MLPLGGDAAVRRLLTAVDQALTVEVPPGRRGVAHLRLLERRCLVARASIGRLITNAASEPADYASEADYILHQVADLTVAPSRFRRRAR